MAKKAIKETLVPGVNCGTADFSWTDFSKESLRIKAWTMKFSGTDTIVEAFQTVYGKKECKVSKDNQDDNLDFELYVGKFIELQVDGITNRGLKLSSPFIKEEIVNKDNLTKSDGFSRYLTTAGNKIIGVVKSIDSRQVHIDVLDAYYKLWTKYMNAKIEDEEAVEVSDLELIRGGYLGKVKVNHLCEVTGDDYVNTVFIPGSQIVLNIESDFEKWVGKTVKVLPQKFTTFSTGYSRTDNCLLCSRKRLLQKLGMQSMRDLYNSYQLGTKMGSWTSGEYEGIITGVLKTSQKCGVFVELPEYAITGMLPLQTSELVNYKNGMPITVKIKEFEVSPGKKPFYEKNGKVLQSNVRVIFE
jgi:hypothetical protein